MKNFKEQEFKCGCGCGLGFKDIQENASMSLDLARAMAKTPFIITSSIRCENHNKAVGGSPTSSHLAGYAFDISCENPSERMKMITAFLASPFTRIGIGKNFIHVDCDPRKPQYLMWMY